MVEHLAVNFKIPRLLILLCSTLLLLVVGHLGPMPRILALLLFRHCFQRLDSCKIALLGCYVGVEGQINWLSLEFIVVETMHLLISCILSQVYIVARHVIIVWIEAVLLVSLAWSADDAWKERALHSAARIISLIPWRPGIIIIDLADVLGGRDGWNDSIIIGYILGEQRLFSLGGVLFVAHRGFSPHRSNLFKLA